jgi:hypothetical protein
MKPLKNKYTHKVTLTNLTLKNAPREEFRERLEAVHYLGYRVEHLVDGREIVVTKPGGKFVFGTVKREDFMVWIHNPAEETLWLISHKNILEDLKVKAEENKREAAELIDALEDVFKGIEPDDALKNRRFSFKTGEPPDALLKAYKWIWGQEDCNYPTKAGREMSMQPIRELREQLG